MDTSVTFLIFLKKKLIQDKNGTNERTKKPQEKEMERRKLEEKSAELQQLCEKKEKETLLHF